MSVLFSFRPYAQKEQNPQNAPLPVSQDSFADIADIAQGGRNSKAECPLRKLNRNGFFVEPTAAGLTLHCDFTINESTEAHVILWTLGKWDALINALGEPGQRPKRITIRSRNLYRIAK